MPQLRMNRLRAIWLTLNGSLWFVPGMLVLIGVVAALLLVELHPVLDGGLARDWPRVFGAGAEGARGMLSAIATSMVTVAGVVFSVTIVALSLTASQYSPRVLRNFMSDRPTQVVLGAFVAVFAYCLVVLRTIRAGDEGAFVPALAVLGGVFMAFVGIGLLIYFVHHVATAIQVDYIVQRIASDTIGSIDRLYPEADTTDQGPGAALESNEPASGQREDVVAHRTGYLAAIDHAALLKLAAEHHTVLRVLPKVGDFVVAGTPLTQVAPNGGPPPQGWAGALEPGLKVQGERHVDQDAAYGLQQLVEVGLRALSPSMHDPATAETCVDHLGALLHRLSSRRLDSGRRECDGRLLLVVAVSGYEDFVEGALASLTHHAGSHASVHDRLITAVETAGVATADPERLAVLGRRLDVHLARMAVADLPADSASSLQQRAVVLRERLRRRAQPNWIAAHADCGPALAGTPVRPLDDPDLARSVGSR